MSQHLPKPVPPTPSGRSPRNVRRRGKPRRGGWIRILVILAIIAGVVLAISVIPALVAGRLMIDGKRSLSEGQQALVDGDIPAARAAFADAHSSFSKASSGIGGAVMKVSGLVPFLGDTPDAIT